MNFLILSYHIKKCPVNNVDYYYWFSPIVLYNSLQCCIQKLNYPMMTLRMQSKHSVIKQSFQINAVTTNFIVSMANIYQVWLKKFGIHCFFIFYLLYRWEEGWNRIRPYFHDCRKPCAPTSDASESSKVQNLSF